MTALQTYEHLLCLPLAVTQQRAGPSQAPNHSRSNLEAQRGSARPIEAHQLRLLHDLLSPEPDSWGQRWILAGYQEYISQVTADSERQATRLLHALVKVALLEEGATSEV